MQFLIGIMLTFIGTIGSAYALQLAVLTEWYGPSLLAGCAFMVIAGLYQILISPHNR